MRIEEKMLILPALYVIKRKGQATTTDLIEELTIVFNPEGEDAEILAGRSDTKFSQKVRNLVSHRDNNKMCLYTDFVDGVYSLTEDGNKYLMSRIDELNYWFSNKFEYEDTLRFSSEISKDGNKIVVYDEDAYISEGKIESKTSKVRERSKALREAALKYYMKDGVIKCCVCGFDYAMQYGELGKGFIEIHHEKPVCEYDTNGKELFIKEAVTYVKPLCANCHRMIHRNSKRPLTIEELKKIIQPSQ